MAYWAFGSELRKRREAAGMSLRTLSKLVRYSASQLSKLENNKRRPSASVARMCDIALGANGALQRLVCPSPDDLPAAVSEPVPPPCDRGQFLLGAPHSATVIVAEFQVLLSQIRAAGQSLPASLVLPGLLATLGSLTQVSRVMPPDRRKPVLRLEAQFADYVGWMEQENGESESAEYWINRTARIGAELCDPDILAHTAIRQAGLALYRRAGDRVVALSEQARDTRGISARIRTLAALRRAQGFALKGDSGGIRESLDVAEQLLEKQPRNDGQDWGPAKMPSDAALTAGWCYYDLGDIDRAIDILSLEVPRQLRPGTRAHTLYGTRLACCYAAIGEVTLAASVWESLRRQAEHLHSASVRHGLAEFARHLRRWHRREHARELYAQVATITARS